MPPARWLPNFLVMKAFNLAILFLPLLAGACTRRAAEEQQPVLAVSIEPQRKVLEELAGPSYKVVTLLGRGANPETFDPALSERLQLEKAQIFFGTGVLPFEEKLLEAAPGVKYYATSEGMPMLYGTHDCHDDGCEGHHHDADPHYWSSTRGIRVMAANMAAALSLQNPDSAGVYAARVSALDTRLDSLDSAMRSRLAQAPTKAFAVWHPSLSYFAADYGLEQISVGTDGKELSTKRLREAIDRAAGAGVKVFFFQKEYDSRQAQTINDGIGSRIVTIDPLAYDWDDQLTLIVDELTRP